MNDTCAVCRRPLPEGAGVCDMWLRIRFCPVPCSAIVDRCRRVYDRSARGRWRPRAEVLRLVREHAARGEDTP